jgi:hypothetical protein
MGLCCSSSRHKERESVLKIPANAPLKPAQSTSNYFKIHSLPKKNVFLLEHGDFPFLLRGEGVETCNAQVQLWLSGVLTPFPFLKNVYWAWPLVNSKEWFIVTDECESIQQEIEEEIQFSIISECKQEKQAEVSCGPLKLSPILAVNQLAEALNHLHSSALIHGNICPSALTFHRPTASLKLAGFHHLQRVQEGSKCSRFVGDDEAFRKPLCQVQGYFEEVDWYSFGVLLKSLKEPKLAALAEDLLAQKIGTGPAVYSSQIKPRLPWERFP